MGLSTSPIPGELCRRVFLAHKRLQNSVYAPIYNVCSRYTKDFFCQNLCLQSWVTEWEVGSISMYLHDRTHTHIQRKRDTRAHSITIKLAVGYHMSVIWYSSNTRIIIHGCEVWGHENMYYIETVHVNFCKLLLTLQISTPICGVDFRNYGRTIGRLQLRTEVDKRMANFWVKLIFDKLEKIPCKLLQLAKSKYIANL